MHNLTEKQRSVLTFVKSFIANKGYPPTRNEIARHFEYRSDNAVQDHLRGLAKKGAIEVARGVSRGIKVIAA